MKTKEELLIKCESFSELGKNWGSYNEDEITVQSIYTASKLLTKLAETEGIETLDVFPMRDGGVQIEVGEFKELEIYDYTITEILFDKELNVISKTVTHYHEP